MSLHQQIDLIVVLYSEARLPAILGFVRRLGRLVTLGNVVFVTNSVSVDFEALLHRETLSFRRYTFLKHTNVGLEFGAYQFAASELPMHSNPVVIANDTIDSHQIIAPNFLRRFLDILVNRDSASCAIGTIHSSQNRYKISEFKGSRWIRSNLTGFGPKAFQGIRECLYSPHIDNLITASPNPEVFFANELDHVLKTTLTKWLFEPGSGRWYGAQKLTQDNCEILAKKARAILQERYLTLLLEEKGFGILQPVLTHRERLEDIIYEKVRSNRFRGST